MIRINDLIEQVAGYLPQDVDLEPINQAYVYSATLHRNHFSNNGAPALQYALEVSSILADLRLDLRCIVAGLLHDVLVKQLAEPEQLRETVDEETVVLIEEVSRLSRAAFHGSEATRAEHMRQMILASTRDLRVILILLADRIQSLRNPELLSEDAQIDVARETLAIYAPIAHRLGIQSIKSEMEDRAFAVLEPGVSHDLMSRVGARVAERNKALEGINGELEALLQEHGISGEVLGRVKHLYSIHRKMRDQRLDLDQINDLLATRIIVNSQEDCYKVLGLVHAAHTPIPGRFKDYIALPKENGYKSLHTQVFGKEGEIFEIQIRTRKMHRQAEMGIAAHFIYKDGTRADQAEIASVNWFRRLLENLEEGQDPHESLEMLRLNLNPEQLFLFTPRGEVIKLPRSATPIDFAYAIHSEVGHHCVGAKMDGRMISIRTPLNNGSVVEILTNNRQQPKKDWLKAAVSSRALGHIRGFLRKKEKQEAVVRGREQVIRLAKNRVKRAEDIFKLEKVAEWAQRHNLNTVDDLFAAEGFGRISFREVLERLYPPEEPAPPKKTPAASAPAASSKPMGVVRIDGMDNLMTRFAKCCHPVHGDPVVGIITRGRGVSVHHRECRNLARQAIHPERTVEVDWMSDHGGDRPATVSISTRRSMKVLLEAVNMMEEEGIPITSGHISTDHGVFTQQLTLMIDDSKRLRGILQRLNAIDGVRAERLFESA